MLTPKLISTVFNGIVLLSSALSASAKRSLVGTWHWTDKYTDHVAHRYLTLRADGKFSLADSYPKDSRGAELTGWWRLDGLVLALNFWNEDPSEEQPCHPDMPLRIIQRQNDSLIVDRNSENSH